MGGKNLQIVDTSINHSDEKTITGEAFVMKLVNPSHYVRGKCISTLFQIARRQLQTFQVVYSP